MEIKLIAGSGSRRKVLKDITPEKVKQITQLSNVIPEDKDSKLQTFSEAVITHIIAKSKASGLFINVNA